MPRMTLTDKAIARKPPPAGQIELWDTVVPGFGLRISHGGKRTYFIMTRIHGRQIRRTVGNTITHTLAEAREAAREALRNAVKGIDPKEAERRARIERERAQKNTFRSVAETYLDDTGKGGGANLRTREHLRQRLENDVFPKWGERPITEITKADVRELIDGMVKDRPYAANRTLALVRRIFNWACSKDKIDSSPVVGIEPPAEEKSRERVLTDDEIRRLWDGFEKMGNPVGAVFKVLLLTGQRERQVGGMKRSEIDGDVWTLPSTRAKNKQPHTVPLPRKVKDILASLPVLVDENGNQYDYVFSTGRRGDKPVSGWSKIKDRLDRIVAKTEAERLGQKLDMKKHAIPDWRIHDLRRTLRTNLPKLGVSPDTAERVIGHVIGGVRGVYDLHAYNREKLAALEAWAAHVESIVSGTPAASNVVTLGRAAK